MKKISDTLGIKRHEPVKKPPHELSATVDLIEAAGLFTKTYGYTYWLGKVKRAKVSYSEMVGIIKDVKVMPAKYSKGGRLTNLLTEKAKQQKNGK